MPNLGAIMTVLFCYTATVYYWLNHHHHLMVMFVYPQVRPLLPKEKLAGEQICVKIVPKTNQLILGKDRAFTFDYVLSSKMSQQQSYVRCMEQLVTACFEGYNATVFAYGQTVGAPGNCAPDLCHDSFMCHIHWPNVALCRILQPIH